MLVKLRIFIPIIATAALLGCSTVGEGVKSLGAITEFAPDLLAESSFVYRPEIQQGNVLTQEQVNELRPGMTKRQVRFLLGSPMLSDVFHVNRWDYVFTLGIGSEPAEIRRVAIYFENDRLVRIAGDMRPEPESERKPVEKEVVVTVPDWVPPKRTLWEKAQGLVGIEPDID